ncbi:MAG: hypothetical protein HYX67_10625 [Candidatus Melainabacteria bacterium]|nr:hypothetical protein [Candidatus Melainabacteria bacterium]
MAGGLFFCCRSTGFNIGKITSTLSYDENWEIASITEREREKLVREVFPQTYYYFGSGNQSYAFVSEDRKYVLKFFKMQTLHEGPQSNFLGTVLESLGFINETNDKLYSERIFTSYKDAYELLRDETGLIYIHFNKTREFMTKATLIDSKGRKHIVDLDSVEFVVQKRANKIYEQLSQLIREDKYDELRQSVRSFFQLIARRCEKGFVDQELSIRNNFGFVGSKAIQFDCATLSRDSSMKFPMNFRSEVMQAAERLDLWARESCPEATLFIQEEAQRVINQSF